MRIKIGKVVKLFKEQWDLALAVVIIISVVMAVVDPALRVILKDFQLATAAMLALATALIAHHAQLSNVSESKRKDTIDRAFSRREALLIIHNNLKQLNYAVQVRLLEFDAIDCKDDEERKLRIEVLKSYKLNQPAALAECWRALPHAADTSLSDTLSRINANIQIIEDIISTYEAQSSAIREERGQLHDEILRRISTLRRLVSLMPPGPRRDEEDAKILQSEADLMDEMSNVKIFKEFPIGRIVQCLSFIEKDAQIASECIDGILREKLPFI